jgi:hypothetical protein
MPDMQQLECLPGDASLFLVAPACGRFPALRSVAKPVGDAASASGENRKKLRYQALARLKRFKH